MTVVGEASIVVDADTRPFDKNLRADVTKSATGVGSIIKGVLGAAFIQEGARAGLDLLKSSVAGAREANAVAAQVAQVIKTTGGAANVTAKQIDDLANRISRKTGIDDEQIASASAMLLTFTNIRNEAGKGNDIFNQSTAILADMSKVFKTDASGAAIQLGKALNDPIQGITALSRVGVKFTPQMKEQIKLLVEHGKVAEAQKIILHELNVEFGGQAEAQATAADKLKVTIGNLQEEIGNGLIPIIDKVGGFLADKLPVAIDWTKQKLGELWTALQPVRDYIANTLIPALQRAADEIFPRIQSAIDRVGAAFRDNRPQMEELGRAIQTITPYVVELGKLFEIMVVDQIAGLIDGFVRLGGAVVAIWDGIVDVIRNSVNKIIDAYNALPLHKDVNHVTFGLTPRTATAINEGSSRQGHNRAAGGPTYPYTTHLVGEHGPELLTMGSRGGYITPNSRLGGNTFNVSVNFSGALPTDGQAYAVGQAVGRGAQAEWDRAEARRSARTI